MFVITPIKRIILVLLLGMFNVNFNLELDEKSLEYGKMDETEENVSILDVIAILNLADTEK